MECNQSCLSGMEIVYILLSSSIRIVPIPTLQTIGDDPYAMFCLDVCPPDFKIAEPFLLLNTSSECCKSDPKILYGCYLVSDSVLNYAAAEAFCDSNSASLPSEYQVRLLCSGEINALCI